MSKEYGYRLTSSTNWSSAKTEAENLGGHLVAINDAAEQQFLYNTFGGSPLSTVVFVDANVADYQTLVKGVKPGTKLIILDAIRDGIEQITEVLVNQEKIDSIHLVSHGSPGCLYLGNSQLSLNTLSRYQKDLASWFVAQGEPTPYLLLYGCNVATGDAGAEFIAKLQASTGAVVAASTTLTGNAGLGGNWQLEVNNGQEVSLAFDVATLASNSVIS